MNTVWKKIFSYLLLIGFLFAQTPNVTAKETLPDLPDLPVFDEVLPPDGMDVFAPSSVPAQIVPKTPQNTTPAQNIGTTSVKTQPVVTANKNTTVQTKQSNTINNSYYKNNIKNLTATIKKGKKFKVRIQQTVSDKTREGTRISFVSTYPETTTYATIPAGTVFKGRVSNTHPPALTGNGGLIVINVDQMVYKGKTYEIDAKVSVANGKRIYLNNIKGKRMYFQSIPKSLKPGTNYFKKMWKVTCKLAQNESGVEIILTPFSFLAGGTVYAVNFIASPVLAIFYKGKSITIEQNSPFTIQFRKDVMLIK